MTGLSSGGVHPSIAPDVLLARIETGQAPLVLDVRSKVEYADGHVPGAVHVPFWLLPFRWLRFADRRDEAVVVYCGHGPRAWTAARYLRRRGFRAVIELEGHWSAWRRQRLPVVK